MQKQFLTSKTTFRSSGTKQSRNPLQQNQTALSASGLHSEVILSPPPHQPSAKIVPEIKGSGDIQSEFPDLTFQFNAFLIREASNLSSFPWLTSKNPKCTLSISPNPVIRGGRRKLFLALALSGVHEMRADMP